MWVLETHAVLASSTARDRVRKIRCIASMSLLQFPQSQKESKRNPRIPEEGKIPLAFLLWMLLVFCSYFCRKVTTVKIEGRTQQVIMTWLVSIPDPRILECKS